MVLGSIIRTAWGNKLLLTAVKASLVDCVSLCYKLKAKHGYLSPNGHFNSPMSHQPTHPHPNRQFPSDTEIPDIAEVYNIGRQGFMVVVKSKV